MCVFNNDSNVNKEAGWGVINDWGIVGQAFSEFNCTEQLATAALAGVSLHIRLPRQSCLFLDPSDLF